MNSGHPAATKPEDRQAPHARAAAFAAACAIAGRAEPERSAILALLGLMAAAEPPTPALLGSVLAAPADLPGGLADAEADRLMAGLGALRLGDALTTAGTFTDFRASPLFDIATVGLAVSPGLEKRRVGWLVRGGQWAYWCLSAGERTLLCRLGRAWLAADNERVGRTALKLGQRIVDESAGGPGPATLAMEGLLALAQPEVAPPCDGRSLLALVVEAMLALEAGRVIADVAYPGPRGKVLSVGLILPASAQNRR